LLLDNVVLHPPRLYADRGSFKMVRSLTFEI
jgi:hypothetical protein